MKNWILFIFIFSTISGSSQNENKSKWNRDIDILKNELAQRHKNLFFKKNKHAFENGLEKIKLLQNDLTDFEIAIKLQQLIASLGDSHTSIKWQKYINYERLLPLRFYWFKDGIYIIKTTNKYKELLRQKIIGVNGNSISEISDSLSTLFTADNNALIKSKIPKLIILPQILDYFSFSDSSNYNIELENLNGIKTIHTIKPYKHNSEKLINLKIENIAYCWKNQKKAFIENFFEKYSIYYIKYNLCVSKTSYVNNGKNQTITFNRFKKIIFETIEKKKPKKIIFDMRFNSGGNSFQGTKFTKQLSEFNDINKKGKLFVVIGRETFSSAIINTMDFIDNTNAIIVGEETGGKPNHFGEIRNFDLPFSKLKVIYSTKYFKRTEKEINTLKPDVEIETSFNEYINGIDPIFDWIKNK